MKCKIFVSVAFLIISLFLTGKTLSPARSSPSRSGPATLSKGWTKTWGGSGSERVLRTAVDASGNWYLVGEFSGAVDFNPAPGAQEDHHSYNETIDAFLTKFDSSGNFLWAKTWGGSKRDVAYGVGVDSTGSAYVVGPFMDTVDFNPDPAVDEIHVSNGISGTVYQNNVYLSKFAPDGTFQWVRAWGPETVKGAAGGAEGYSIAVDGNFLYVAGDFSGGVTDFNPWGGHDYHANHPPVSGPIFFDSFLSKFDLDGNFQWAQTWGGEGYDDGPGVAVDGEGNLYVAGMYASQDINFDPDGGSAGLGHPAQDSGAMVDVFLTKFDANGDFLWVRTWGGQGTEDAMGTAVVDAENFVYVSGRYASLDCDFDPGPGEDRHSTNGGQDAFVSKFDPDGNFVWARTWGGSDSDNATSLGVDSAGNLFAAGWFSDAFDFDPGEGITRHASQGQRDAFISQFDSRGSFYRAWTWGGSGSDSGMLALDMTDNVYGAGEFVGLVDFDPGAGEDFRTSNGGSDAFFSQLLLISQRTFLPVVSRASE